MTCMCICRTDSEPPPLHFLYGNYYFGGFPIERTTHLSLLATADPFIGCIGDATVNGVFINFANATDRRGAILGKCPSADIGPSRPSGMWL
jgi:laminin alpha 3/5